jgi:uncharacterized protein (DUF433 family)
MASSERIDWSECPLVETKAGVQSGAPVLRGTRMPVSAIIDNYDYGVSIAEIAEQFEIPAARIEDIVTYAQSHRLAHPA